MKELFRYSQLAERLGDQKKDHADGSACASLVPKRKPIPVPAQWWANFDASSLQEVVGNQTNGETFVESPSGDEKNNTLRVGCRGKIVDWAVEIRFYRRLDIDADYVQLQVVGKPGDNTDVNWEIPVIGPDGTVTLPGTRWSDRIWTGKTVLFPLPSLHCMTCARELILYAETTMATLQWWGIRSAVLLRSSSRAPGHLREVTTLGRSVPESMHMHSGAQDWNYQAMTIKWLSAAP